MIIKWWLFPWHKSATTCSTLRDFGFVNLTIIMKIFHQHLNTFSLIRVIITSYYIYSDISQNINVTENRMCNQEWSKSTRRKPTTCRRLYHIMLYRVHLTWAGFELATLVVVELRLPMQSVPNYYTITTTTASTESINTMLSMYIHNGDSHNMI
jgi:hypothetical protein